MNINKVFTGMLALACGSTLAASHIGFLMPSGARQDSRVEIIVGGQGFWGSHGVHISGGGVTVEKVSYIRNLPNIGGTQRRYYNQILRQFHDGKPITAKKPESTEGWRNHSFHERLTELTPCERDIMYQAWFVPKNSLQASPAIAGRVIVVLKIDKDAKPGVREFRLADRNGTLSNPLKFFISDVPEVREDYFPFPPAVRSIPEIPIPSAVNGQIMPGETDQYTFKAAKGEEITFKLYGRFFNPFIGDGVPGHFQAVLEVFDAQKKSLAYADDYYFDPDPVLTFKAPADGVYTLKIRDAIYRGREDFVYRVEAFKGKYNPPPVQAPNFAGLKVLDMCGLKVTGIQPHPIAIKNTIKTPAGNDYRIKLKKDEEVVLEVFARRLGLPPDTVVKVYDKSGKMLAFNDDTDRFKAGTVLHNTADSLLYFTAPADGVYRINVSDTAKACGEDYKYFLRIDHKRPRFAVYSTPSFLRLEGDGANKIKLQVERFDQYNGPIKLKVLSPAKSRIVGADTIPANCSEAYITITGEHQKHRPVEELIIEASCGKFKTRVIAGNEAMQAFAYTHINPAQHFLARYTHRGPIVEWKLKNPSVTIGTQPVTLTAKPSKFWVREDVEITLKADNLPDWLEITSTPVSKSKKVRVGKRGWRIDIPDFKISLKAKDAKAAAGKCANVIFYATWQIKNKPDKNGKVRVNTYRVTLPALQIKGE